MTIKFAVETRLEPCGIQLANVVTPKPSDVLRSALNGPLRWLARSTAEVLGWKALPVESLTFQRGANMSKLKKNESVTRIMTKELQTINVNTSLSSVGKIFSESNFHHLPVVSGSKLIGIVSFVDLMRVNFADSFGVSQNQAVYEVLDRTLDVESIMTREPTTLDTSQSIREAAEVLAECSFHALPIVDQDGDLQGMVTSADLLKYLLAQY